MTSIIGKYVTGVVVSTGGLITATYGNDANTKIATKTMQLSPSTRAGSVIWKCETGASSPVDIKYPPL